MQELPNIQAWLHRAGSRVDHKSLDRMADLVMGGMTAVAPEKPMIVEKMTVLTKVMAIILASFEDAGCAEIADDYCDCVGSALRVEVARLRKAAARDSSKRAS